MCIYIYIKEYLPMYVYIYRDRERIYTYMGVVLNSGAMEVGSTSRTIVIPPCSVENPLCELPADLQHGVVTTDRQPWCQSFLIRLLSGRNTADILYKLFFKNAIINKRPPATLATIPAASLNSDGTSE